MHASVYQNCFYLENHCTHYTSRQTFLNLFLVVFQDGTLKSEIISNDLLPNINKVVQAALAESSLDESASSAPKMSLLNSKVDNLSPVIEFLEGKHCLTGVSRMNLAYSHFTNDIEPTLFMFSGYWLVEI